MMQGDGFEDKKALLDDFIDTFSETEDAVIKTAQLKKIIDDFASYNESFVGIHPTITQIHSDVESIASGCDVITRKSYTKPKPTDTVTAMDDFVSTDKTSGFVPEFRQNFLDFHDKHSDDIDGSTFKTILDTIVSNLTEIVEGMNNGTFDISRYTGTKGNINWTNITDVFEGKQLEDYLAYIKTYQLYLQGLVNRCQVYKYDPVNMSSGNYINDRVDLTVGGLHKISLRRFYNAQSETKGILGRGWSCLYDTRLTENLDGKISITTFDGRSLIYEKTIYGKEEAYLEIHGEEGVLRKSRNGYRITKDDGTYTEYDREGYLRSEGENDKDYISIIYDTLQIDGEVKPLPVKVVTDDGSYIELFYDSEGYLTKIIDNTDRTLSYGYEIRVIEGKKEYFLTDVTYPNGAVRRYSYNEQGLIDSVLRPDGIVALRNEYDEKRRVTHQIFPDGGEMSYSYDDEKNITTATEQNGLKVEYLSDERGRNIGTRYVGVEPGDTVQDVNNSEKVVEEHCTYNERNQKTSVTDRRGYTTRYFYDRRGHLTKVIGPDGLNVSYTYNADGKLVNKKDSEGNSYKYTYDLEGNLYSITDPEGNRTRYYYEDGKVTKIKSADRLEVSLSYDENGHIKSITDKAGVTTKYECDSLGRVIATIDALGNRTEYTLDESDNITQVTDPLGNVTRYAYNSANLLEEIINPDGTTKTWAYNEIGKPAFYTDEEDRTTRITYNKSWKEENIILPNGGEIHYTYDLFGNRISVTDPMGRETSYTYDKAGNILSVGIADNNSSKTENNTDEQNADNESNIHVLASYTYDKRGRIKTKTDGNGNTTSYTYDRNGNLICRTDALGGKTTQEFDPIGRVISVTDALGNTTGYTYTKQGDVSTITDPAGRVRRFSYKNGQLDAIYFCDQIEQEIGYDSLGRVNKRTFVDGYEIAYSYDALNRVIGVSGSDGRTISYEYDAMGRAVKVVDGESTTCYTYTATGKIKSVTDALGNETAYTYDSLDNIASVQRAEGSIPETDKNLPVVGKDGHVTLYDYDLSGQLITITDALGQKEYFSYDQYGRLKTKTDRDGYITDYEYNNAGSVTKVNYADGRSVALSYNALNQLNEINDWLGKTTIENDALGRLTKVTDFKDRTVAYEYNEIGAKTKLTYPDGRAAVYSYDELGRLSSVTGNGEETRYTYDELGRLVNKNFANGVTQGYSYLPGGNLKSMESYDREGVLDKYFYSYDNSGLISRIDRKRRDLEAVSGQYSYDYDAIGRLIASSLNGQLKSSYEYDAFGNRTSLTEKEIKTAYKYDVLDRLVEAKELNNSQAIVKTYEYDKRGNQTKEYVDGLLTKTFTFDATNMLSKVVDSNKGEVENEYNGLGFRVASTRPEEKIEYLCDLSRDYYNLLERTVNGETESFIYDNNVVSMSKAGNNNYYLQDELGSPMYMTGTDGVAVSTYAFDDFGRNVDPFTGKIKEANHKHGYTTDGNIIQPFAFTGYQEDEVSGLKFAQARFYDATTGRFQSEDNVKGFMDSPFTLNHYGYCWGNPVGLVDADGNLPTWAKVAITVGVVAATAAVVVATGGLAAGAIAATAASVSAGTVTATAGLATTVAIGATGGAIACGVMDAGYQGVQMTWGKQDHFDTAQNMGAMTNGAIFGGLTATGVGFFGTVAAGGISAAGGNMVTQYQKTGTINSREVATATAGGMLGAGIGYGIAKCISYALGRIGNTGSIGNTCPSEGGSDTGSIATPNSGQGFSPNGYNPQPGERTLNGYVKNNASPEVSLHTNSAGFNNNNGIVGGDFKRFGAESHGGVSPHVHQPQRNVAPNGNIYGTVGTKTANGGVTLPTEKDVKQLYEYIVNGKYH
jgi:RHS repeat-associated protein